jgi:hypothetical protein
VNGEYKIKENKMERDEKERQNIDNGVEGEE